MFNFSLDWSTIGSNGPLYTPWWAQLNYFAGLIGMIWVVVPLLLATNFWYVPMNGSHQQAIDKYDVIGKLVNSLRRPALDSIIAPFSISMSWLC
jgi:hypothetical protein